MQARTSDPEQDGWWHYKRSLASRVTVLTTLAVGLTVAFVALGAYVTVRVQMQSTLDAALLDRAERAAQTSTLAELNRAEFPSWAFGAADVRIAFLNAVGRGRSIDGAGEIPLGTPELEVAAGKRAHSIRTLDADGVRYRVVTVPTQEKGVALVIAQSLSSQEQVLDRLGLVMLCFGLAGVIVAGLAGWGVARNGLRPVRRLTAKAEEIARTDRLTPIKVEGTDEIARLSTAFNSMLVSLDASRDRQRQLIADASHELRTPLTSLRTNLDLLIQADASGGLPPAARSELLEDVRAQIDEMTTLIGDLVELARDEHGSHVVATVDLADVLDRAITRVRRRAPGVSFDVRARDWWVTGEEASLERAVTNLLDNAAKWSPDGGTVTVRLDEGVLTVSDEGPGIAEADRPKVFERFYRSEESRAMPGSGLGLSIVRQTALRHSGWVDATAAPGGGACLTLTLPGSPTPPAAE
ncbi:HAMP domain-containing sensor histidine kinase [Nocardioides daejeonensis]|uniref:HAMP domain-containing sensor histidine kinase n=1 Tax=Nocardioides daejeonensis TaxID=1046556 RepID=UPI000D743ED2|nr:HAMP domain-containing sensor histidine kinase [Nocardioides daejeonensis]